MRELRVNALVAGAGSPRCRPGPNIRGPVDHSSGPVVRGPAEQAQLLATFVVRDLLYDTRHVALEYCNTEKARAPANWQTPVVSLQLSRSGNSIDE
jgi:hypothetical protein